MKVSLLQLNLHWENPAANLQHISAFWQKKRTEADLIVLPEMFATGFTMNTTHAETMTGESVSWMKAFSEAEQCLLIGSLMIQENGQFFNRLIAVEKGEIRGYYDKKHLFRMANEHKTFTAGEKKWVIEYQGWKICPLICYDLRFPVWARNHWKDEKPEYDILLYVANWPERRVKHWEKLLMARAIENQCFVLGVNRVGADGNAISYTGSSAIIDFLGNSIVQMSNSEETVLSAQLSLSELVDYRTKFPAWQDADDFSITIK